MNKEHVEYFLSAPVTERRRAGRLALFLEPASGPRQSRSIRPQPGVVNNFIEKKFGPLRKISRYAIVAV